MVPQPIFRILKCTRLVRALYSSVEAIAVEDVKQDDYHLPEDDNHHSHRRGNLKSYICETRDYVNSVLARKPHERRLFRNINIEWRILFSKYN
jgi:hypothetical protein